MKINSPVTQIEKNYPDSVNILSTTDLKGKITYVNEDFITISGFSEDELIGHNHNVIRHPDMPPAAFAMLWSSLKAGKSWMGLVKNRCKNGDYYWVDAYATPIEHNGVIDEYQSVRRKPKKVYVERAKAIYPALMVGKTPAVMKQKNSFRTKVIIAAILPLLIAAIVAVSTDNSVFEITALVLGLLGSMVAVYIQLLPLDKLVKQARTTINDPVAQYVYTGRADDLGQIQLALTALESETAGLIGRIADSASSMSDRCDSLSDAMDTSKNHVHKQFTETEQVASAINQMSSSIQDVARNAQNSADAASKGLEEVGRGKAVVDTSAVLIEGLKQQVATSTSIIRELEQSSKSIAIVLNVINEIAEQTNLLALNAAIEAARAGEAGRGFAVVADEVRSLANRTHASTEEIKKVVERLQHDSGRAVEAMEAGLESADSCAQHSTNTVESLNAILNAIELINDMSIQIASAVEQQSAVAEEISRSIHTIRDSSEQNLKGVEHSSSISSHMVGVASAFESLVGQFWSKQANIKE
ncbi:MAG: PAS domain-containing methyl-accepting chemotaxis protein [Gammaproteobacteria bacterium]|nr:PAS domain-containing methyl-accepting chemotaxis protein [Gammaproteobacteria bacterium]